jgi:glycosyltransferase involved in cell wall biosynthesis
VKFSLLMPYYGESSSVIAALRSILFQDMHPTQIVIVDNGSSTSLDDVLSGSIEVEDLKRGSVDFCILRKEINVGLAAAYNTGLGFCKYEVIVVMQPDIVLPNSSSMRTLVAAIEPADVVIVGHVNSPVADVYWHRRTLFEKAVLAPSESNRARGFNGQFDAFRKSIAESIGGFKAANYRTAGEDGDFVRRMSKVGRFVVSEARAEHRHDFSKKAGLSICIQKSLQYGNAQGASARHGGGLAPLYREAVLLLSVILILLNPHLTLICIGSWVIMGIRIPFLVYRRDRKLLQGLSLIAIEFLRLFAHSAGAVAGFLRGRQSV